MNGKCEAVNVCSTAEHPFGQTCGDPAVGCFVLREFCWTHMKKAEEFGTPTAMDPNHPHNFPKIGRKQK